MKRSLSATYDDDDASATVFGVDMGSFEINLYKGNKRGPAVTIPSVVDDDSNTNVGPPNGTQIVRPNFSDGVVVECARIRGDVIAFHRDCQAVLVGARGETDGVDDCRRPLGVFLTSRFGFSDVGVSASWNQQKEGIRGGHGNDNVKRGEEEEKSCEDYNQCGVNKLLLSPKPSPLSSSSASVSSSTRIRKSSTQQLDEARSVYAVLETALSLLEKDRLCAQLLGMQSLVLLTDLKSSSLDKAYLSSLCVLGSPMSHTASLDMNYSSSSLDRDEDGGIGGDEGGVDGAFSTSAITRIHKRILRIIMKPGEDHNDDSIDTPSSGEQDTSNLSISSSYSTSMANQVNPEFHISMRRMAIQTLTNALSTTLYNSNRFPLLPPLHCAMLHRDDLIKCVALDLAGAARPYMAVLTCAHDAALAARLLRLIVRYRSDNTERNSDTTNNDTVIGRGGSCSVKRIGDIGVGMPVRKVQDLLKRARVASKSYHGVLEVEVERVLNDLAVGGDCDSDDDVDGWSAYVKA